MRHRERPGKRPLYASAGVHVVAVLAAWGAQVSTPNPEDFETIQITLVSPPPAEMAPEPAPVAQEEVVVETPEPVPAEEPPPVVEETARVEERPTPTPTPTPPPEPEPREESGDPEPASEVSGEDLNVRMEGLRRDFPEYYANIIRQIQRCFEYRGAGRLETSVVFYISRDGTVNGGTIDFVERSGNVNFDYAAMGAVECAGSGRFGPLPEELGLDRLPILFTFTPRGGGDPLSRGPEHPTGG
jgi:outer membrane biosynthesis protein TonB